MANDKRRAASELAGLWVCLGCVVCGCAATNEVQVGVAVDAANRPEVLTAPPALLISASEAPSYSTTYLGLVEVTFENRTGVWKQVDRVAVDFGSPAKNQSVTIATAEDIDAWRRAIRLGSAAASGLTSTGIEMVGMGPLETLGTATGQRAGTAATVAVPAAATLDIPGAGAAAGPSYPDQHLLSTPFRIPPGLSTRRWILLSTPDNPPGGCVDSMIVSYQTSDHATGRVLVRFKVSATDWQGPACAPPVAPKITSFENR